MTNLKKSFSALLFAAASVVLMTNAGQAMASASTKEELNREANEALNKLIKENPAAAQLAKSAKAVLVFPEVVKAGFIFGGAYGEGELIRNSKAEKYYNTITASWGLQAGGQSYGYVVFLMNDKVIDYLNKSYGWEIGVGPTVVLMDEGAAKNFSSTTANKDAYAFIFDQKGLMGGISLEGTKITRIRENGTPASSSSSTTTTTSTTHTETNKK